MFGWSTSKDGPKVPFAREPSQRFIRDKVLFLAGLLHLLPGLDIMQLLYCLYRSLYIPTTCYYNCRYSLPESRGPGFLLPSDVVNSLMKTRNIECQDGSSVAWHEIIVGKTRLPKSSPKQRIKAGLVESEERDPLLNSLLHELDGTDLAPYSALVLAGEGEPTLVPRRSIQLIQRLVELRSCNSQQAIRLTTNGLSNPAILKSILQAGVDQVSVSISSDHDMKQLAKVVDCIRAVGCELEITAVQQNPELDQALQASAQQNLGQAIDRWRTYFP